MKFNTLILFVFVIAAQAEAQVTHFTCMTNKIIENKSPTEFSFSVETTENEKKISYLNLNDDAPVVMTPSNSVLMLNDNYLVKMTKNGIELSADGAGCQLTKVLLYKNSGFKSGYAQVKDTGCGVNAYSTITCKIK